MNVEKLLRLCAKRQNPLLALKIMKRYHLRFEEANRHYLSAYREQMVKDAIEWGVICDSLLKVEHAQRV